MAQIPHATSLPESWKLYPCFGEDLRMIFTTNKNIIMLMAPKVFTNIILHMFKVQQKKYPTQNKHIQIFSQKSSCCQTGTSLRMKFPAIPAGFLWISL